MKISKGLGTYAGLVGAIGQYILAIGMFLQVADVDPTTGLGALATATLTLYKVLDGRFNQATAALQNPKPAASPPVTFSTPMTSGAASDLTSAVASAMSGRIGGSVGLGFTTPTGATTTTSTAGFYPEPEEPGDPDALPDYQTDENVPPDEGDTSANGDVGERES